MRDGGREEKRRKKKIFFFKQKTAYEIKECDWSSDVCSSDLWAVVTENEERLYLVRETKSTHEREKRRENENQKIDCGKAHFDTLGVNFKVATNIHEVLGE